jgi:hypothetical protein
MPRVDTHPAFCYLHAKAEAELRDAQLRRSKFLTRYGTFQTSTDINQALGRVFNLLTQGRISAREAIALGFISQLLLQTVDGLKYEVELTRGFEGYEDLVREIVDPPPDELPAASSGPSDASDSSSPALAASVPDR